MNLIDILLVLIILLSVWSGWQKGFIAGILDLATWVGSLLAGFFFYQYLASLFEKYIPSLGVWTLPVAFILTIIIARFLIAFIMNSIWKATPVDVHLSVINKFLGIVPGAINGFVWAIIVSALLLALPLSDGLSAKTRDSRIAGKLAGQAEWLDEKLSPVFDKAINQTINKLTIHPESNKSVQLPFTVANPIPREDLESKMLQMVNEEREKQGLNSLQPDPELTALARQHCKDMFARGYFAHITPEGKTPSDRIREAGIKFSTAGENLALAQTLPIAHQGLMNSPGHRANILYPSYGRVGIGILDGGIHGLMIAQEFRN